MELRRRVVDLEPDQPEGWYALAQTLARSRSPRPGEAAEAYGRFVALAEARKAEPDNANTLLIRYRAGPGNEPAAAVLLAQSELERRHDVETLAAAAVALLADGEPDEARAMIDRALAVGVRDAAMYHDAGRIAAAQDTPASREAAARFLRTSLDINGLSLFAQDVRSLQAKLAAPATPATNP